MIFPRDGGLHPPFSVIASWPAPDHISPETRGWSGPIALIIILCLAIIVYTMRLTARLFLTKNAGLDDLLMSIAMIPLVGLSVVVILAIKVYGFQWHAWDQTPKTLITTRQFTLAIEVLYLLSTTLIKVSILCFYRRLTSGTMTTKFTYWVWGTIAFTACYCVAFFFAILFTCSPVEGYWHIFDLSWRFTHELKCHNEGALTVAVVVISMLEDFVICALPIFLVWNLQIPQRQKAALIGLFAVCILTCICAIMRTYYAIIVYYYTYDITWMSYYGWLWTAFEADLGVICASAPALNAFFRRYLNFSLSRSGRSDYEAQHTSNYFKPIPGSSRNGSHRGSGRWDEPSFVLQQKKPLDTAKLPGNGRDYLSQRDDTSSQDLTAIPRRPSSSLEKSRSGWFGSP